MNRMNLTSIGGIVGSILLGVLLAILGSSGGVSAGGLSVFAIAVLLAFVVNVVVFVPSFLKRTEHYYDLTGSSTYLLVTIVSLVLANNWDARSILLSALIAVWALRLGSFLFLRVRRAGKDRRFDKLKHNFGRFLMMWCIQGLWVSMTLGAALAAITAEDGRKPVGVAAVIGLLIWVVGFGIEVVADRQKSAFKSDPANNGRFITSGLWAWSRHPNYFGEILLWFGIALIALPNLGGWRWATLISPVFVWLLITRISGVPMLEARAEKKWGSEAAWQKYKAATPELVLRPPR